MQFNTVELTVNGQTSGNIPVDMPLTQGLQLQFSANVYAQAGGSITIHRADGSIVETLDVTDPDVSIDGATVRIKTDAALESGTGYYANISTGAFADIDGNAFAGILDDSWRFRGVSPSITAMLEGINGNGYLNAEGAAGSRLVGQIHDPLFVQGEAVIQAITFRATDGSGHSFMLDGAEVAGIAIDADGNWSLDGQAFVGELIEGARYAVAVSFVSHSTPANPGYSLGDAPAFIADAAAPEAAQIILGGYDAATGAAKDSLKAGDYIEVVVYGDETLVVSGIPVMRLELDGGQPREAEYVSGAGSSALTFRYVVQAADAGSTSIAVSAAVPVAGGSITDRAGNALAVHAGAINLGLSLDNEAPAVMGVDVSGGANGYYRAGDVLRITVDFSEAVHASGNTILAIQVGNTLVDVPLSSGSGSGRLVFDYTVPAGAADADGIAIPANALAGAIADAAGNLADLRFVALADMAGTVIDTAAPAMTHAVVSGQRAGTTDAKNVLDAGDVLLLNLTFSETVFVNGSPSVKVQLDDGSTRDLAYVSGSGTGELVFGYTIVAGDNGGANGVTLVGGLDYPNGASLADAAGNDIAVNSVPAAPNAIGILTTGLDVVSADVLGLDAGTGMAKVALRTGDEIVVELHMSDVAIVGGTPRVELNIGGSLREASYVSGSNSDKLVFKYVIEAGLNDAADGVGLGSIVFDSGNIRNLADAGLSLAPLSAVTSVVVDNTAPATPLLALQNDAGTSASDGITNTGLVSVSGIETGARWEYSVNGGASWSTGSAAAGSSSSGSFTLAAGAYGAGNVLVRVTDLAGNASVAASLNSGIVVDSTVATPTLALATDSGASSTDGVTNARVLTVSGLEAANLASGIGGVDHVEYKLGSGSAWTTAAMDAGNSFTLGSDVADGAHTIYVRQVDKAGNASAQASLDVVLDRTVGALTPALATDTGTSSTDGVTRSRVLAVTGLEMANLASGVVGFDHVEYKDGASGTWRTATGSGSNFTLGNEVLDGRHTIHVRQVDKAGNISAESSLNMVLDTTAASTNVVLAVDSGASSTDRITNSKVLTVTGLEAADVANGASGFSRLHYAMNGGIWVAVGGTGPNFTLGSEVVDGNHTIWVSQLDNAGNLSTPTLLTNVVLDRTVGAITVALATDSGASSTDGMTNARVLTVSGLEAANLASGISGYDRVEYKLGSGGAWTTAAMDAINSFTLGSDVADGAHTIYVRQVDKAGNASAQASLDVVLDRTVGALTPALATDTGTSSTDGVTRSRVLAVTGLETTNLASGVVGFDHVEYKDGASGTWRTATGSGSNFTLGNEVLDGSHTIHVRQVDKAGNISAESSLNMVLDTTVDTVMGSIGIDSGSSTSDNITNSKVLRVLGLEAENLGAGISGAAQVHYAVDGGTWNVASGSGTSYTMGAVADGFHTISVRQVDVVGNASVGTSFTMTLDTSVAAPTLALTSAPGVVESPQLQVSGLESGAFAQYRVDGGVWTDNYDALAKGGAHTVEARQVDKAGNISAASAALNVTVSNNIELSKMFADDNTRGFAINGVEGEASGVVSSAGDVNGDGLEDLIVGASGGITGRAYVVFGRTDNRTVDMSAIAAGTSTDGFVINGNAAGDLNGQAVSGAGDVNGDGLADLIVGAPSSDTARGADAGRAFVVFGKTGGAAVILSSLTAGTNSGGFSIDGPMSAGKAGFAVSAAGDVNGDGLADVIVGVPEADNHVGRSYVVYGKSSTTAVDLLQVDTAPSQLGFMIRGGASTPATPEYPLIGTSVAGIGDVNGDGLADVLIGAPGTDASGVYDLGRSYVVFGSTVSRTVSLPNLTTAGNTDGFMISGQAGDDQSGYSVAAAGDVNGDGLADFIIGAPYANVGGQEWSGRSYVVFGKTSTAPISLSALTTAGNAGGFMLVSESSNAWDFAGYSVSSAGDINGDGLSDLIIGAPGSDANGHEDAGRSYVVYGKTGTAPINLSSLTSGVSSDGFVINGGADLAGSGGSVSAAGDVNGDGYADLIVGATGMSSTSGAANAGRSYVIFGGPKYTGQTLSAIVANGGMANGTTAADNLIGSSGNDTLSGKGGADAFYAGAGNDTIVVNADNVAKLNLAGAFIDGGSGVDMLRLGNDTGIGITMDLTQIGNTKLHGIERFDITGTADNTLKLSLADVLQLHDGALEDAFRAFDNWGATTNVNKQQIVIDGNAGDKVVLTDLGQWTAGVTVTDPANSGHSYVIYTHQTTGTQLIIENGITVL